jgi:hypothetical protein
MPGLLTEITEIATALGTLAPGLSTGLAEKPMRLLNVDDHVWSRIVDAHAAGHHLDSFRAAFANGVALLRAEDGLRDRPPKLVEWKGPHRPPGDNVVPADLRIDHVYQVSCKYLSRIMQNSGPVRLFDRLLVGEERSQGDWFALVAPLEYQAFYSAAREHVGVNELPPLVTDLDASHRAVLKEALRPRALPQALHPSWSVMCAAVSARSAARWQTRLTNSRSKLRLLWRLLRIGDAPYFVLGTDGGTHLRLRVASAWDWLQAFELRTFSVAPRISGQPEVDWLAVARDRSSSDDLEIHGHIEIRWSHGRFQGSPEAKVYLDIPHTRVPGYFTLL